VRAVTRGARAALAATALLGLVISGALQGCGQKGPLYLPQQKKSKVPATPINPAPDTPDAAPDAAPAASPPAPAGAAATAPSSQS
jgi:predicted small lipoprotein YifL